MAPNNNGGRSGKSATVAFIDIRSASKALRSVRTVSGQPIHISYYEPGSTPFPPPSLPPTEASVSPPEPLGAASQGNSANAAPNNIPVVNNNCIPNSPVPGMYRQRFPVQHGYVKIKIVPISTSVEYLITKYQCWHYNNRQSEDSSSHFYDQPKSFSRGRGDGHFRGRRENRPPFHNRHSFPVENRYT